MQADHSTERKLSVTRFSGARGPGSTVGKRIDTTRSTLCDVLASPSEHPDIDSLPLFKVAAFRGDTRAKPTTVLHVDAVCGDYDGGEVTLEEAERRLAAAGVRACLYTTRRHTAAAPRWRVLAPLAGPISEPEHQGLLDMLNGALGGILAPESWDWSRSYFWGRVRGVEYKFATIEGEALDVVAMCPDFEPCPCSVAVKAARAPKTPGEHAEPIVDDVHHYLDEQGLVLAADGDRLHVACPWADQHTSDSGTSSTSWLLAGTNDYALGHFSCRHTSHGTKTDAQYLDAIGYVRNAFEDVVLSEEQAAAGAAAAIRNAQRPPAAPRLVLETQRERAARIGREGEHTVPTQRVMTGTEMLEELMFIADGSRVSFVGEPRFVLPYEEFKRFTAGSVELTKTAAGRSAKVHRAALWVESPERKTVRCQTFAPGRAGVCVSPDNVLAQNLWRPRAAAVPADWREISAPFFEHVAYLVPEAAERERFLDWLAHIEQDPGTLPSTHYLLVAKQTGIGRNWLAYAMARVFAGHTALGFDLGEALRTGFNGALSQTLLAVVDELHEGGPGGSNKPAAEKLKSMLTEATRRVNPKYGRQHVEFNCTRFLMFSNHEAALPLADNDRRVVVIENPGMRRSGDYYARLYALLDHPDLGAALAEAFRQRDIAAFNPGEVAPMSAAKARTIRAGRSEVEQAVRDVAGEWPSDCITSSRLHLEVSEALGGKVANTQGVCVAAGLMKYPGRVKVAGRASHVWALREQRAWASAAPADVAAEVLRGVRIADRDESLRGSRAEEFA